MQRILIEHARRYPLWRLDDLYKLVHQAAMGSEHAVIDEARARAGLVREIAGIGTGPDEPLVDPISPDGTLVRVHLRPYLQRGLAPGPLLDAFVRTARDFRGSTKPIGDALDEAEELACEGLLGFREADIASFALRMRCAGFPAVHHSEAYVAAYRPAYRVVARASMSEELAALCDTERPAASMLQEYRALCESFAAGARSVLGSKLYALLIYGAVTFPETQHTGDVDFHAILVAPPTVAERAGLLALHERLAREVPPLGTDLDGYYILLDDARRAERPHHVLFPELVDDSWALHRAHMLAGCVVVLCGPGPDTIYVPPTPSELEDALDGELNYVTDHLTEYPAYGVLNLCRLLYSWETGDVVTSKAAAAEWASKRFLEWRALIALASRVYADPRAAADREALAAEIQDFYAFAASTMARLRGRPIADR